MLPKRRTLIATALALLPLAAGSAELLRGPRRAIRAMHWFDGGQQDARDYFGDNVLLAHDGRAIRFYSDLLMGRTVLVNVVATQCRGVCNTTTHRLAVARDALGDRFGRDIFFVSITSDPERDSVDTLREYARSHGVEGPGWTFVTGPRPNLERILERFGQRLMPEHMQFGQFALGNVTASRWTRLKADAAPRLVAERLRDLAAVRAPA